MLHPLRAEQPLWLEPAVSTALHRVAKPILGLLLAGVLCLAQAQAQGYRTRAWPQDTADRSAGHALVRYGKWLSLAATAGATTYGILANRSADRQYADLERICRDSPARCTRLPGGAFADVELERQYQDVLRLDDRAQWALIAGQAAVVATVALFIIDLPRGGSGRDIPYQPPRLQIGADEQARLVVSYRWQR
jgi:hypothetical protein